MPDSASLPSREHGDFGGTLVGPPAPNILETEVKGDLSLYDADQEKVLVLNSTATDVWLLCDGEHTVDRIVELVAAAHGQKADVVRGDVETTIHQFLEEGFVAS
jgi:hypothetical protein